MGANPLMVMQNLYIVHGNPAWSAKFLISCINTSGRFSPLRYEFTGKKGTPQYGCRAYAYDKQDREHKEPLYSIWITMELAEKEGWTKKAGSKWNTMADQMLIYRAAAFWQRAYAPEISMGFLTREGLEDGVKVVEDAEYSSVSDEDVEQEEVDLKEVLRQSMDQQKSVKPEPVKVVKSEPVKAETLDPQTGELFS
jgi:hypothetical protein